MKWLLRPIARLMGRACRLVANLLPYQVVLAVYARLLHEWAAAVKAEQHDLLKIHPFDLTGGQLLRFALHLQGVPDDDATVLSVRAAIELSEEGGVPPGGGEGFQPEEAAVIVPISGRNPFEVRN